MLEHANVRTDGGVISVQAGTLAGRPPGMGAPLILDPARTALVIVDVQQYFLQTPPFTAMREVVQPLAHLLPAARAAGVTVVHLKTEFGPDMEGAGRPGSRTRQMMDAVGSGLARGSAGAAIPPELGPEPADIIVVKTRFSGFWNTDLDKVLRARRLDTVIFAGGTTTVCVESTVRDAVFLEFNAVVLADCTRDLTADLHESALRRIDMFFGWVCDSSTLGEALRAVVGRDASTVAHVAARAGQSRATTT